MKIQSWLKNTPITETLDFMEIYDSNFRFPPLSGLFQNVYKKLRKKARQRNSITKILSFPTPLYKYISQREQARKDFTRKFLYDLELKALVEEHLNYQRNGLTESCTEILGIPCSLPQLPIWLSTATIVIFYYSILQLKKFILKIAIHSNLKFCFTEISWRKNMINSKMTLEEMTSSTAIYLL